MKLRQLVVVVLVLLAVASATSTHSLLYAATAQATPDVYVGIDIAYGGVAEAKALIDKVSTYTNLIVFGCTEVTQISPNLDVACQYAYDKGMYFIVYGPMWSTNMSVGGNLYRNGTLTYQDAKAKWGDHLLGIYQLDEPGGKQIDFDEGRYANLNASTYAEATSQYEQAINRRISSRLALNASVFTSDYALYWFDYKAGYTSVFAEFGWNYSRQINVALCRGAAEIQDKEWGAMITWTYTTPPYIEAGAQLYQDMVLAYDSGAKYIIVFDANEGWTGDILQEEHLEALQQFWQYTQSHPRQGYLVGERTAYVLPDDYAFGFRGPEDKILGLREANETEYNLSIMVNYLLETYADKLDIIYDDGLQLGNGYGYGTFLYWYEYNPMATPTPIVVPPQLPTITQPPSLTPSPSLIPTPSPMPTLTPTPVPTSTPTPSLSPMQTQQPTPTQDHQNEQTTLPSCVYAVAAGGAVLGAAATAVTLKKRH